MDENGREILLVEDNPADAELTIDALSSKNLNRNIKVLEDGQQALEYIYGHDKNPKHRLGVHPILIILDLKLPKVDGLEILKKVKSDKNTKMIPVVVLTSSNEIKDIEQSYQLGVNSYMVKPVDYDDYMNSVSKMGEYWLRVNRPPG